jgi:glycosyltransferase involved in cell wall biosynthesis
MKRTIFVNATALNSGGGLSILRQFLEARPIFDRRNRYYVFTGRDDLAPGDGDIELVRIDTNRWSDRLIWDNFGCQNWARRTALTPDMVISLQNTGLRFPGRPQLVYYHQPLPLSDHRWKFYKKSERTLFLYQRFYPFFVSNSINANTVFVVQLESIKEAFCRTFGISDRRVRVLRPTSPNISLSDVANVPLDKGKLHLLYPAMAAPYKNHAVLLRALSRIRTENPELFSTFTVHFTLDHASGRDVVDLSNSLGVNNVIRFHGNLSFESVLSLYKCGDALLFPSFIETYGLPLVEAASFGLPILVADLPYSREVLHGYNGATFLPYDSDDAWASAIGQVQKGVCFAPLAKMENDSWEAFFHLINEMLVLG